MFFFFGNVLPIPPGAGFPGPATVPTDAQSFLFVCFLCLFFFRAHAVTY